MIRSLFASIEPANALGIEVAEWDQGRVVLTAPLAGNRNDKATAFAGSIASVLSLAGWAALSLTLQEANLAADVMLVESQIDYRAAIRTDLRACAELLDAERDRMLAELAVRGRCRVSMQSCIDGAARMHGSYAVFLRTT